jgi:hypothetical protein
MLMAWKAEEEDLEMMETRVASRMHTRRERLSQEADGYHAERVKDMAGLGCVAGGEGPHESKYNSRLQAG